MQHRIWMYLLIFAISILSVLTDGEAEERFYRLTDPVFDKAENFSDGMAAVSINGKYGYINRSGKIQIEPQYDEAGDFIDGYAYVITDNIAGFINDKGINQILIKHNEDIYFSGGLAVIKIDSKFGYIKKDCKIALKPVYEDSLSFNEGLAAIKLNGKYGYINRKGKVIIKPVFESASSFTEGVAVIKINSMFGYINTVGKIVIKPVFNAAGEFHSGYAPVKSDDLWGYITRNGKFIIKPQFQDAKELSEGIAAVKSDRKWGYIIITAKVQNSDLKKRESRNAGNKTVKHSNIHSESYVKEDIEIKNNSQDKKRNNATVNRNLPVIEVSGYVGVVDEVKEGQVIILADKTGEKIYLGAWCIFSVTGDTVIIKTGTPISTIAKCDVPAGILERIKSGMKVYKSIR